MRGDTDGWWDNTDRHAIHVRLIAFDDVILGRGIGSMGNWCICPPVEVLYINQ